MTILIAIAAYILGFITGGFAVHRIILTGLKDERKKLDEKHDAMLERFYNSTE